MTDKKFNEELEKIKNYTELSEVSQIFYNVLNEPEFKNNFKKIVFAILEGKSRNGNLTGKDGKFKPFYDLFS